MDFLISPLGWKNWLVLISVLINLSMVVFIFSRGIKKNKINLYFSLFTISTFLWGVSLLFGRTMIISQWQFWAYFAYIAALAIALFLFYFTLHFPYQIKALKTWQHLLVILPAIFLSSIIYVKDYFIVKAIQDIANTEYVLWHNKFFYILYSIYFLIMVLFSLHFLWIKYKNSDGILKRGLFWLFVTILLGLIFGTYFDLILCYFNNFHYIWVGQIFTLFINLAVFYLIFFTKEK
ncbi:MAG: hypothetical protein UR94_C0002G0021 [Parcubacteria group bacterium GW2011_GWA2_36_10]|nr:MAG: hypothetical protein UR94_C0002G0021 [Parcubacteria group bacterium GW2011_GWA2_36_10]